MKERKKLKELQKLGWTIGDLIELLDELNVDFQAESEAKTPEPKQEGKGVQEVLTQLGIRKSNLGYRYIIEAMYLAKEDSTILNQITKRLYPTIAERVKTTPARVERAIRHAIEAAWNVDNDFQVKIFGTYAKFQKPTNAEFLSVIAEYCNLIQYNL